jgi:hypothetical protein
MRPLLMISTALAVSWVNAQPRSDEGPELSGHDAAVLAVLFDYKPSQGDSYCLRVLGQVPHKTLVARLRESGRTADSCASSPPAVDILELTELASGQFVILLRYRCAVLCGGETRYKLSMSAEGTVSVVDTRRELEFERC